MTNDKPIAWTDQNIRIEGDIDRETIGSSLRFWRLPAADLPLFEPTLVEKAACAAGVRIRLRSDTDWLRVTFGPGALDHGPIGSSFDLLVDGDLHAREQIHGDWPATRTLNFAGLPAGEHELSLYLPQGGSIALQELAIAEGASLCPVAAMPNGRWLTYGSSITQAGAAAGPSETWPALVARQFGLDLTCMGYGGECHLEPLVSHAIRQRPVDYLSACLGINVYGRASLGPRTFRSAVIGLIQTIREGHPDVPFVAMSPIFAAERETTPNAVGFTLPMMREIISEVVALLRDRGDTNLHYLDGLKVISEADGHLLPDNLHPNAEGYRLMAERFGHHAMPMLGVTEPAVHAGN